MGLFLITKSLALAWADAAGRRPQHALSVGLIALLVGCGGGGGYADPGPGAAPYDLPTAYRHLLTTAANWSVSGAGSDGANYRIDVSVQPRPPAVFPVSGVTGAVSDTFQRLVRNGTVLVEGTTRSFYNTTTLASIGTDEGDGSCTVATSNTALPATAQVGATGAFASHNELASCQPGSAVTGSSTTTWSLETDAGYTFLCLHTALRDAAGASAGTGAQCVEIAANGTPGTRARVNVNIPGFGLVARNY